MGPFQKDEQVGAMCTPSGLLSIIYRTCTRYYPKHFTSIKSINSPACSQKVLHPHFTDAEWRRQRWGTCFLETTAVPSCSSFGAQPRPLSLPGHIFSFSMPLNA